MSNGPDLERSQQNDETPCNQSMIILVKCIGFEVTTIDQIVARSGLDVNAITCCLADLELQGMITAVPGGDTEVCA